MSNLKQVIVMRTDLGMRKGKMVAQGAHASFQAVFNHFLDLERGELSEDFWEKREDLPWRETADAVFKIQIRGDLKEWLAGSHTKICVQVHSESELLEVFQRAQTSGLPCSLIVDQGLTEFHGIPTKTCVAIGPASSAEIDPITNHLTLL